MVLFYVRVRKEAETWRASDQIFGYSVQVITRGSFSIETHF